jgi:hypothetical protein
MSTHPSLQDAMAAVKARPKNPFAWLDLGNAFIAAGDRAKAKECYERALSIDPDFPEAQAALNSLAGPAPDTALPSWLQGAPTTSTAPPPPAQQRSVHQEPPVGPPPPRFSPSTDPNRVVCQNCGYASMNTRSTCKQCKEPLASSKPISQPTVAYEQATPQQKPGYLATCGVLTLAPPLLVLLFCLGLMFLGVIGRALNLPASDGRSPSSGDSSSPARRPTAPSTYKVTYIVTGSAESISFTINNAQGNTEQGEKFLPYREEFDVEPGFFAYISAQNQGDRGSVKCRILVNDREWQEAESVGAYKIASCSGTVGRD